MQKRQVFVAKADIPRVATLETAPFVETVELHAAAAASSSQHSEETPYEAPTMPYQAPQMPVIEHSSASSLSVEAQPSDFPLVQNAIYPVSKIPNWGAMRTPAEWNRTYSEMTNADFVSIPRYNTEELQTPLSGLLSKKDDPAIQKIITEKLFYSTRFFAKYDLDAAEFTGIHPGIDLKLALGTPLGAIAAGRVHAVTQNKDLGTFVVIEHHTTDGGTYYSIYGHLGSTAVTKGQNVVLGQQIGAVGLTGNTSGPHVHLQVDTGSPGEVSHTPYLPEHMPTRTEASQFVVDPIWFISRY